MAGAFMWDDKVRGSGLTAPTTAAVSTMPLSNLTDEQPRLRTRFAADNAAILVDFGAETAIECVALVSNTLDSTATIRRRMWTADGTRANRIRNPAFSGAADGTPGTLPTYTSTALSGLTQTLASGTDSAGKPYLGWRIAGTTSSTFAVFNFDENTGIAAAVAQALVLSVELQLVAGSTANISSFQIVGQNYDSGGGFVGVDLLSSFTLSATAAVVSVAGTLAAAGTAFLLPYIKLNFLSGVAVDITLRIYPPRLELGTAPTLAMYPAADQPSGATALLLDTGAVAADTSSAVMGNVVCLDATATTGRYMRLDVVQTGAALLDLGRLVAGPVWRLSRAHGYGIVEGREMLDRLDRNAFTGATFAVPAVVNPRFATFSLAVLSNAEAIGQHRSMIAALGAAGQALWIPETTLSRSEMNLRSLWASVNLPGDRAGLSRDSHAGYSRTFALAERL